MTRMDLKHFPIPPVTFNKNVKFIYVYGDPRYAAISLFRRNYHFAHSKRINRLQKGKQTISPAMTIEGFAQNGIDLFHFKEHFDNWYKKYLFTPTLFIKYDSIFRYKEAILEFLNLPSEVLCEFPEKKQRITNRKIIDEHTYNKLSNIYCNFLKDYEKMSDFEIRTPMRKKISYLRFLYKDYHKAIIYDFLSRIGNNWPWLYKYYNTK